MHNFIMDTYGEHIKNTYCCPDKFTMQDLCELKCWGEAMTQLLKADKEYNIVKSMEERDESGIDMEWDEFQQRFTRMYNTAEEHEKMLMRQNIMKIIQ